MPAAKTAKKSPLGEDLLAKFEIQSEPGNERVAMKTVAETVRPLLRSDATVEAVKTAVAEAVMNAIEHGNASRVELPVTIEVLVVSDYLVIRIIDKGLGRGVAAATVPDLTAKLEGRQSPRGWGLFLIREMVDGVQAKREDGRHTLELRVRLDND